MSSTPIMDRLVLKTVDRHLPFSVHLDLTYRCNERCVHCYLDHQDYGEMSTAEMKNVLDQLAAAGTLFLTLSGGEIFLRQDFFELLEYARNLHFDVSLKTNALLITPERARMLKQFGVRKVQVSLYSGEAAVHDAITLVPGSLERSLEAIRFLKAQGMVVTVACPIMKQNVTAYRSVLALAEELNVPYVLDMTITPMIDGNHSTVEHRVAPEQLLPILSDVSLNPKLRIGANACLPAADDSAVSSGMPLPDGGDDLCCSAGHNTCYISPYGEVFPCVQLPLAAGNVRTHKFDDIWYRSPEMGRVNAIRESQLTFCGTCAIRAYCERCPGLAMMEGGDIMSAYERACVMAEMNARLAGEENAISALHAHWQANGSPTVKNLNPARTELISISPLRSN
jgi:radical SAM protein with 4Fe4S-binding SPASM domain